MGKSKLLCYFNIFIATAVLSIVFQNCSDVQFATQPDSSSCSPDPNHICHETRLTLKTIQPAVAVRGASCLMCHAEIRANIITDFGRGTDWYWGGSQAGVNTQSWYNNYVNTWQSARSINGSVYVPDDNVPTKVQSSIAAFATRSPMKILEFMNTAYVAPWNWGGNTAEEGQIEMSAKVTPVAGEKIIAKNEIVIQSPTEDDISILAPNLWVSTETSAFTRVGGTDLVSFLIHNSGVSSYVTNDESVELQCAKGDIVVKGTLFLRNLRVNASGGCRLYVSGSVFVEGPITYAIGADQNLQITSANGIFLGLNVNTITNRLITDARGVQITGAKTYAARSAQAVQEAKNIGNLKDAKDDAGGPRLSINYTGLLLNAPMIHSRYLGVFKGTIIGEIALFALGQFHFEFDEVFTTVNVLPLLKKPILSVK